uniref:Uncharacterized protein n=1 Tax=Sus scrofa TaxID=9823 RepID=A0A8D1BRF1_PIG
MGNKVIAGNCSPYICLLGQLLKKGGAKTSESKLLELFQTIEKHCDWFLTLETLYLKIWETVGRELRILHDEGIPIPVSIWSPWSLIKSVLEHLQTTEDLEEEEEGEFTPLLEKPKYAVSEQNYHREYLAPMVDSDIPLLPIRSEVTRTHQASTSRVAKKMSIFPEHHLPSIQQGILQAPTGGNLDAIHRAFPVTVRETVAPSIDPANPGGVYEFIHEPFPLRILKELKQAFQNYGVHSPFTKGIMQGVAEGNLMIPADWHNSTCAVLLPSEYLQFKSWWQDHAQTTPNCNQARNLLITKEQLLGIGPWSDLQDQMRMNHWAIEQIRQCCLTAWGKIETKGQINTSFQKILQGPKEPFTEFLARLQEALK